MRKVIRMETIKIYECPNCGALRTIEKGDCECGRKGKYKLLYNKKLSEIAKVFEHNFVTGLHGLEKSKVLKWIQTYGIKWVEQKVETCLVHDSMLEEDAEGSPNFIEVDSVEKANEVDLEVYRLVSYSDRQGKYVFTKRARK